MSDLAEAYPDEVIAIPDRPTETEFQPWYGLYFTAFAALMHDRTYAGMGGVALPISYLSISRYAADHRISEAEFDVFMELVRALDEEWLDHMKRKSEMGGEHGH